VERWKDVKEKKKYPMNPLAKTMSYSTRIKRFNKEKDEILRKSMGIPAMDLADKLERLVAWWNV
jgi:hypothetical protein